MASNFKRGTNALLPVQFTGLDWDDVVQIEFIFKRSNKEDDSPLKTAVYVPGGDMLREGDVVYVPWTREDTYAFPSGKGFFMDTRVTLASTIVNPDTGAPVSLSMTPTLFRED